MEDDLDHADLEATPQVALTIVGKVPAIVADGSVFRTTAPELFDTGDGAYIGYAKDWSEQLARLFPDEEDLIAAEAAAIDRWDLADKPGEIPSIFCLVAMTLED